MQDPTIVAQVTTGFGSKVAVAPRLFLRELTDILHRVDQHQDFDPAVHYKLTVKEDDLRPEELAALRGDSAPADEELAAPPPQSPPSPAPAPSPSPPPPAARAVAASTGSAPAICSVWPQLAPMLHASAPYAHPRDGAP